MKIYFLFICISVLSITLTSCQRDGSDTPVVERPPFIQAERAFRNALYHNAENNYLSVWNDDDSPDLEKALSGEKLAYFAWHLQGDISEARRLTMAALPIHESKHSLLMDLARYESEALLYEDAEKTLRKALEEARSDHERTEIITTGAEIILNEAITAITEGVPADISSVLRALQTISAVSSGEPGNLDSEKIRLGLALISNQGSEAYRAWRGYFRIPAGTQPAGILGEADALLNDILPDWKNGELSVEERDSLIIGLARSRFYGYADLVARILPPPNGKESDTVQNVKLYYGFCASIDSLSADHHRDIALHGWTKEKTEKFHNNRKEIQKKLWNNLSRREKDVSYSESGFQSELYREFGTVFKVEKRYYSSIGKTGLFFFAHAIKDEEITIEQYGYRPSVRYMSLDFMYCNSYEGWFSGDKTAGMGGWTEKGVINRMRRAYSDRPLTYWRKITDEDLFLAWKDQIEELSIKDDSIAAGNPHAYLPGLVQRIRFDSCLRLLESLKAEGLKDDRLRLAFLSRFESLQVEASIFAHEGRHVIDRKYKFIFEQLSKDWEYRAKLSELIFSPDPFFTLAFSSVYMRSIGRSGKHPQGSLKLVTNLVTWIEQHQDLISGFDASRPVMPQLDLLTRDQLRTAVMSMDPLHD